MRILVAFLAVLAVASPAAAQPSLRAFSVVDGLGVDEQTGNRLIELLSQHDQDVQKLHRQRAELKRRLVTAHHDDPKTVERLLEDSIAIQRAFVEADERLLTRVRQVASPRTAAKLLVLLAATEPAQVAEPPPPAPYAASPAPARVHDPDALFPPAARGRRCDPFASMHGCRY